MEHSFEKTEHAVSAQDSQVSLAEMMNARDLRCMTQRRLLEQYRGSTLICLTLNIPGPVKVLPGVPAAFEACRASIESQLCRAGISILHTESIQEKTGWEAFYVVDGDARTVKRLMLELEDGSRAGRLFDLDVLLPDGGKLSREDLGFPPRRCLLCGETAQVCARSRRHSVAELVAEIQRILSDSQHAGTED